MDDALQKLIDSLLLRDEDPITSPSVEEQPQH